MDTGHNPTIRLHAETPHKVAKESGGPMQLECMILLSDPVHVVPAVSCELLPPSGIAEKAESTDQPKPWALNLKKPPPTS